jgi:hypothetical protein
VWSKVAEPAAPAAHAERPRKRRTAAFYLGAGAVATVPVGSWRRHAYAGSIAPSGLDQFGPGGGGRIALGVHWRRLDLALELDMSSLDTHEWDDYAGQQGNRVSSRAWCVGLYAMFGGIVATIGPVAFALRGGVGYAQAFGGERFEDLDLDYSYTFLRPTFSARQSLAVIWAMSTHFDLSLGMDHNIGTSPVKYDGDAPFWSLTFNLQLRLWLGRRPWR